MSIPNERTERLLSVGSEITGATVGCTLGFLGGVPLGAVGGNVIGVVAAKLLQDVSHRMFSHREDVRIGATAAYAIDDIRRQLQAGNASERCLFCGTPQRDVTRRGDFRGCSH